MFFFLFLVFLLGLPGNSQGFKEIVFIRTGNPRGCTCGRGPAVAAVIPWHVCLFFFLLSFVLASLPSPNLRVTRWLQQLRASQPLSFKPSGKNGSLMTASRWCLPSPSLAGLFLFSFLHAGFLQQVDWCSFSLEGEVVVITDV